MTPIADPQIKNITKKKLVGMCITTSLAENKTIPMWQQFMPRRAEVGNRLGADLYSVQVFPKELFTQGFNPTTPFERWATVEVSEIAAVPAGMSSFILPGGRYAVFQYKGTINAYPPVAQYIFGTWFPNSGYELDDRPHFEILGSKYLGPTNPASEEEIWIPIK